jgi:N-acetylglucosaminyldiphosphoundecaprenol N-acetyl-beta-D-mannosaminyltransferase
MSAPLRTNVLGVGISATNMPDALATIQGWIARGEKQYVCVTGVHGVVESLRHPELRRIHNASGLTVPDGMPMVWLSRRNGFHHVQRVYGPDLLLALCAVKGYSHFFYGGAPGVAELLAARLRERFPDIHIVGTFTPPFRPLTDGEEASLAAQVASARPDVIWVGLSTPKQEMWMASHLARLDATVLIGVGAAFDFHTGRVKQAPLWMRKRGLEWVFRLVQEPKRLWRRYLLGNARFIGNLILQRTGLRSFPLEVPQREDVR